jgi:hypothetical protein
MWIQVTDREFHTILGALREYQANLETLSAQGLLKPEELFGELVTNNGQIEPLNAEEIDILCEAVNTDTHFSDEEMMIVLDTARVVLKDPVDTAEKIIDGMDIGVDLVDDLYIKVERFLNPEDANATVDQLG